MLEKLNKLNLSLQGENINVFTLKSKMEAFIKKLNIWKQKLKKVHLKCSHLQIFLANNDVESDVIKPLAIDHLSNLLTQFQKYFLPELDNTKLDRIQNPFAIQKQSTEHLSLKSLEELADLSSDSKINQQDLS